MKDMVKLIEDAIVDILQLADIVIWPFDTTSLKFFPASVLKADLMVIKSEGESGFTPP